MMQSELNSCYVTIRELLDKIFHTVPFSEQSLQNDQCVKFTLVSLLLES